MIQAFLFAFNRPDILELQVKSLRKFVKNKLSIHVVQDRHDDSYDKEFTSICRKLKVKRIIHDSQQGLSPSQYHAQSVEYVYNNHLKDGDVVLFLDHDMFAVDEIDLLEALGSHDILGLYQQRGETKYLWPGIMVFKYDSLKNIEFDFSPKVIDGKMLDSGGGTHKLFGVNLNIADSTVEYPESYNEQKLDNFDYPFELHMNKKFLHMRNSCQWNNNFVVTDFDKKNALEMIMSNLL